MASGDRSSVSWDRAEAACDVSATSIFARAVIVSVSDICSGQNHSEGSYAGKDQADV